MAAARTRTAPPAVRRLRPAGPVGCGGSSRRAPGAARAPSGTLRRGPGTVRPTGEGGQASWRALPPLVPAVAACGAGQCGALGLTVEVGKPGLSQGLRIGGVHHRGLLGCGTELDPENAAKTGWRESGKRPGFGTAGA